MKTATMKQAIGDRCPQLTSLIEAVECGQGRIDGNCIYLHDLYETDQNYALGMMARYPEYVCTLVTHDLNGCTITNVAGLIEEIRLGN